MLAESPPTHGTIYNYSLGPTQLSVELCRSLGICRIHSGGAQFKATTGPPIAVTMHKMLSVTTEMFLYGCLPLY